MIEDTFDFYSKDPRWISDPDHTESEIRVVLSIRIRAGDEADYEVEMLHAIDRDIELVFSDLSAADKEQVADIASKFIDDRYTDALEDDEECRQESIRESEEDR